MTGWKKDMNPRVADEVNYIVTKFEEKSIQIGVEPAGRGVGYMYADGQLLVRDEHLGLVREVLHQPTLPDRVKRVIGGVVCLFLGETTTGGEQPTVPEALHRVDRELGRAIATPNHVLTVAQVTDPQGEVSPCTPYEPTELEGDTGPFPGVCPENSGRDVQIYIADTGLLQRADTHPWLKSVVGGGGPDPLPDPTGGVQPIPPYAGHGTFVAGVARCTAPAADVFVSNALSIAGSALESELVRDLDGALGRDIDIFDLPFTAPTRHGRPLLAFEAWVKRLRAHKGVVCIAAAGNSGSRRPSWPAASPEVISVGALDRDLRSRAKWSNHGGWVDVYAPGTDLINAYAKGTYTCYAAPYKDQIRTFFGMARWGGTSFASAIVAGLVADRMSRTGEDGRQAAAALLAEARSQAVIGTGAVLLPCGGSGITSR